MMLDIAELRTSRPHTPYASAWISPAITAIVSSALSLVSLAHITRTRSEGYSRLKENIDPSGIAEYKLFESVCCAEISDLASS
jgi:hypothetical protein